MLMLLCPSFVTVQFNCIDDEPDRLSNRLLEYDPIANKWTELCPMMYSKYRCSAVVLNNEIYVMGKNLCFYHVILDRLLCKNKCSKMMLFSRWYWLSGYGSWTITPLSQCGGDLQPRWRSLERGTCSPLSSTVTAHHCSECRSGGRQDICVWVLQSSR